MEDDTGQTTLMNVGELTNTRFNTNLPEHGREESFSEDEKLNLTKLILTAYCTFCSYSFIVSFSSNKYIHSAFNTLFISSSYHS